MNASKQSNVSKQAEGNEVIMPEPAPIMGYRPKPRYRDVTLEAIDAEDGAQPFSARIRSHLTFGQIDAIPNPIVEGTKYVEIEQAIAPYVVGWNVLAENVGTGELEVVPPPAEAGPEAFKCVSGFEVQWLAIQLKQTSLGSVEELHALEQDDAITQEQADQKKDLTLSEPMLEPNDDESSA